MKANPKNVRRGQTATEYMLLVSVVVVSVVGAAYAFVPTFKTGVNELGFDVSQILAENGSARGGYGIAGDTVAGGGAGATRGQAESAGVVGPAEEGAYDPMNGLGDAPSVP